MIVMFESKQESQFFYFLHHSMKFKFEVFGHHGCLEKIPERIKAGKSDTHDEPVTSGKG